ncbi:pirin-like C-terminal cupin domain-containing protein [Larkinella insperata]|uniref:Pirin-like C-terminal cupin domain-containing protein n=1 Tax=Larkinella insperata TaxID=332158 RepID=A0ABW3Q7G5_9BACT
MAPFIGFDHFQFTYDVFGPHYQPEKPSIRYLFEDSVPYYRVNSDGTKLAINPGSLFWTWENHDIVDTEFPIPSGGRVHGLLVFATWLAFQEPQASKRLYIDKSTMPEIAEDGVLIKVVIGSTGQVVNPVETPEPITFLHVFLSPGKAFKHVLPTGWNGTFYITTGSVNFANGTNQYPLEAGSVVSVGLSPNTEDLTFSAEVESQLILLGGLPQQVAIFRQASPTA